MILFLSGLPGSGKSTIGNAVADKLGWKFVEADDFLDESLKDQIQKGVLLTPEQLDSWVMDKVIPGIVGIELQQPVVAAGLLAEEKYVDKLTSESPEVVYVNLLAPYEVLKERVRSRSHFAKEEMLNQCWEVKEKFILPGVSVDGTQPIDVIVQEIVDLVKVDWDTRQSDTRPNLYKPPKTL